MWELPPDGTLRMTLASNPTNYYSLGESGCQTKWSDAIFLHKEKPNTVQFADVAELADALDSGSSARKGVEVQVLSSALLFTGFLAIAGSPVFRWWLLAPCRGLGVDYSHRSQLLMYSNSDCDSRSVRDACRLLFCPHCVVSRWAVFD